MDDLPQELVDLVIDNVAAAKTRDIGRCGLVCRRWLPRSRTHLFSQLELTNYRTHRRNRDTFQTFFALLDNASLPLLSLVRAIDLDLYLAAPQVSQQHMERLQNHCPNLGELRIYGAYASGPPSELEFVHWVHTHVPRFGAACLSLTLLDFFYLPTELPINVLADILSALPFLTELRLSDASTIRAGIREGSESLMPDGSIVYREVAPRTISFPPNLRTLSIALSSGTSCFFRWLLLHDEPPKFTSLTLRGVAVGWLNQSLAPVETYLRRFGSYIESLSLGHRVKDYRGKWSLSGTHAFEARVLANTTRLVNLELCVEQLPETLHITLMSLPSMHLATLKVQTYKPGGSSTEMPDWPAIDAVLATPQFGVLQRIGFMCGMTSILTAEAKALMPQARILCEADSCIAAIHGFRHV